ncbi:hypothetical protein HRR83_001061 [Exophiala dermatitidis]|uniref:C3H1-type domain-containing protein n=1 Tax=Exophiala dermatitidis TaxID=5970 RepID=A0AAN6IX10_EXODE|nr:hypothetical protein HRR74_001065 [Exophiala dermatitidis]KAJ4527181.1 hypothetical protein HRR73_001978 [Exophiala dermatitidis]KAJ4532904.1 hypothetical protein HRR76_007879 [Exophiala dermatitidis]KAJ4538826.1 hypothetical protein HRR77_006752 [Exophiala dermatitidis]KAJ4574049.1 hypothetical protein HRR79_003051 [Exophiala dermatitidis]
MSQPFSFPPPPPPPPKRNTQGPVQQNTGSGFHNNRGSFRGGPPSRAGFRGGRGGYAGGGQHAPTGYPRSQSNTFSNGPRRGSFVNGPQKRDHASAFPSMNQARPRPVAPPAVPSFNASIEHLLPPKPPEPQPKSTTVPKVRKHNLLGLTPASLDQASEPEDDEGEEERLVAQVTPSGQAQALHFEYKGRVATLRTPEEIAAWIAERKKRYPTLAKAEAAKEEASERKRKWEEEKQARLEAKKAAQAKREQERNERERAKRQQKEVIERQKQDNKQNGPQVDTATLAQERAEKLRKKALRAERQLAKAEEALRVAEAKANAETTTPHLPTGPDGSNAQPASDADDLTLAAENESLDTSSDSELTDSDDYTSSSGSSGTDTESEAGSLSDEASDSDSAPEVVSTKGGALAVDGPMLQPSKKSLASTRPCRNLIKFGRCKFGSNCRFSHEKQNHNAEAEEGTQNARLKKGKNKNSAITAPTTDRRKGLFQVMVEKEQEEERRRLLEAIITLGEKGMLDDPVAAGTATTDVAE